jgi:DNA-binding IclR family transcriptional regulator
MSGEMARNEAGQFATTRSPADVLGAMEPSEPYTARELAEKLGWPRRTAYKLLSDLAEEGMIRRKKTGHRTVIWIQSDREDRS